MKTKKTVHTKLGGSALDRATVCPASVVLSLIKSNLNPPEEEKSYTLKGTRMHEYAESILKDESPRDDLPKGELIAVQKYIDWAEEEIEKSDKFYVEPKLYSKLHKEISGSIDLLTVSKNSITVADLKSGFMLKYADCLQLKLYAYLVYENRKKLKIKDSSFDSIKLVIYQTSSAMTPNIYLTDIEELLDFRDDILINTVDEIKKAIKLKKQGKDLKVNSTKECKFCPVSLYCKTGGR